MTVAEDVDYDASFEPLFRVAYSVAYRMLGDRASAEDVAAETLASAWTSWPTMCRYAPAWVARVSANRALKVIRRRKVASVLRVFGSLQEPAPVVPERHDLIRGLRRLSPRQREVVVMRYLADIAEEDVASALGISVGSVKTHASRGLAALRHDGSVQAIHEGAS